jgi:hypothetical protein
VRTCGEPGSSILEEDVAEVLERGLYAQSRGPYRQYLHLCTKKASKLSTYARDELGRERSGDVCIDKEEERAQLGACDAQMRRRARVLSIGAQVD